MLSDEMTDAERTAMFDALGWPAGAVPFAWLREIGPMAVPSSMWTSAHEQERCATGMIIIVVEPDLPLHLHPCYIVRRRGDAVMFVDAWSNRYDLLRAWRDQLDEGQIDSLWTAFGWSPGMVPTSWLEEVGPMAVPEELAPEDLRPNDRYL